MDNRESKKANLREGITMEDEQREAMVPSINVLKTSDLIKAEDVDFLKAHTGQFEKRYRTRSYFRSKAEMEGGVLRDDEHPTPDSKYWQAIGEQNVHLTELISLDYEAKKLATDMDLCLAEIEELEFEKERAEHSFEKKKLDAKIRRKKIEHEQNKFNQMQMEKTAQERMREIRTWEPIIEALLPQLKYGDENFELHHPERYYLRYKRRADNLGLVDPEARENVISHAKSFEKTYQEAGERNLLAGRREVPVTIANNVPPGLPGSCQVDYGTKEDMDKDDPIAKSYFDRKVRTIRVGAPHRKQGDRNATNFIVMQPPAGFNCDITEPFGYTVPDARNFIVQEAINEGIDYIFFVDDDVIVPRNALVKLIKHKVDVVGGMYYRKYFPLETVGMHENGDGQPGSMDDYTIGDIIHNTLVLPSGCTLIKVEVLKKIEYPWYKIITVNGRPTLTEDTYLCQKLKNIGVDIITDTSIQCIHVDYNKGVFYGHPNIVDQKLNAIRPEYRDYFAI